MNITKEKRRYSLKKAKNDLKQIFNTPQTLEEYFVVIGIDPKLCTKEYLYNSSLSELNDYYLKEDFKPKILSKFPPVNKKYINIDSSLIDLCFPDGYKLEKFYSQPDPKTQHFLLDNSFYSINYPLKYVTCLKIYENLENYFLLNNEIKDKLGDDYFNNTWKINTGKKSKNDIEKAIGNINKNSLNFHERFKSEITLNISDFSYNEKDYKIYYFPKILCLVSTEYYFTEQKKILKQLYQYYSEKSPKKIPLEKKILTILFNIPLPPKGLVEIEYNLKEDYQKIKLRGEKMNKISSMEDEFKFLFNKFTINSILIIFHYIIFETKTIIFSTNVNEISFFIYGIISLLFPFHYSFQISSSIPNGAYDIIESISPYILGVNKKFEKSFFTENKIDMDGLRLLIIDLDEKKIKFIGDKNIPEIPKSLYNPLLDGLKGILGIKKKKSDKKEINFKAIRSLFFDFFVNLLSDYDLYIKKDYFKNKLTNTGINNLFKIKEFVSMHAHGEKQFYQKFTETQMFSDFIYKKMIPKSLYEKLEILFFDENIIRKNNKKLFAKKKKTVFLDSKEYEHTYVYEIPQSQKLSKKEKNFFVNEQDRNNLLFYGQKVNKEINQTTNEEEYTFEYFIFPVLNKSFFEFASSGEYFLAPDSIIYSDVDRANTDLLSKSMNNPNKNCCKKTLEEEMQNYIYLTYIELWAYSYWYLDPSEKDNKFNQLLDILNKITHHEVELFDLLFEALNKFQETDKILQLYDCLLNYKIPPSSFIYSIVNCLLNKNKFGKSLSSNLEKMNIQKNQKRTFHSIKEDYLLGDKVIFFSKQLCPECEKELDIIDISLNFKNMKKEIWWTKCPFCGKDIIPKLDVLLGSEININNKDNNNDNNNNNNNNTSILKKFILHSPYELKTNIKNIINRDGFKIFDLEYFKEKYPTLFWSCIWFFKINKIDLDIILRYESKMNKEWNNRQSSLSSNLICLIQTSMNKENGNNINKIYIINKKKKKVKIKKYSNDILIIHSVISMQLEDNKYRNVQDYNISSISSLFDLYRKSTLSSINKSNTLNLRKDGRGSAEIPKIENTIAINIDKKFTMKSSYQFNLKRVRLNALSKKEILSPNFKPRKLFESITSSDLLSIKESDDYLISSFDREHMKEENDEDDDLFLERIYSKKETTNIFNFEDDINNNSFEYKKNRSFDMKKKDVHYEEFKHEEYKRSTSEKNKRYELYSF